MLPSLACALLAAATTQARFNTTLGNIDVTLLPGSTPGTVAAFTSLVSAGSYDQTLIQRSVPGFVVQGGGYFAKDGIIEQILGRPTIRGEPGVSNTRGTLAMALSNGPDSAVGDFFFNLVDNSAALDGTADGGPFTVFGQVTDAASLAVMDSIAAQQILDLSSSLGLSFASVPVVNVSNSVSLSNLVYLQSIDVLVAAGSPDYAISASPAQLSVKAGSSGTTTLTVTPSNGFSGTVTPACGTLPSGVTCSFAPATVTLSASSGAQTTVLTVTASASAQSDLPGSGGSGMLASMSGAGVAAAAAGFFGLACVAVTLLAKRRRRLAFAIGALALGCGGSSSSSHQTYNVAVRLSGVGVSHPVSLAITLN